MSSGISIAAQAGASSLGKMLQEALAGTATSSTQPKASTGPEVHARSNAAIDRCCAAYNQAYEAARAAGKDAYDSEKAGKLAYRRSMPSLDSEINIRDFVACVTHAFLADIFGDDTTSRLLYAAQVANSIVKSTKSPRSPGRPPASAEDNPTPTPINQPINTPVLEN